MTSLLRIAANRRNARRSTGPRTRAGKARSAQNARRHGLCLSAGHDPARAGAIAALARLIAGPDATPHRLVLACAVAVAHIDVARVRRARCELWPSDPGAAGAIRRLAALDRYERRALALRSRAMDALEADLDAVGKTNPTQGSVATSASCADVVGKTKPNPGKRRIARRLRRRPPPVSHAPLICARRALCDLLDAARARARTAAEHGPSYSARLFPSGASKPTWMLSAKRTQRGKAPHRRKLRRCPPPFSHAPLCGRRAFRDLLSRPAGGFTACEVVDSAMEHRAAVVVQVRARHHRSRCAAHRPSILRDAARRDPHRAAPHG